MPHLQPHDIRVLVVDDDAAFVTFVRELLGTVTGYRCQVEAAETAAAASRALAAGAADICLLDYYLPDGSGVDVLKHARDLGCRVPIVLLTGNGDEAIEQRALRAGATDYLEKQEIDSRTLTRTFRHAFERARATAAAEVSAARFRALVEHDWDGLFVMDDVSTIEYAGPSSLRIIGYTPSELVGTKAFDLLHPEDRPRIEAIYQRNLANPGVRLDARCRFRHRLGHYIHVLGAGTSRLHDPAVRGYVLNFRDESEQRELESRLQRAQQLEAIGRLAAGIAHDFNNVLTVILGTSERMLSWFPPGDIVTASLVEIRQAAHRASLWTRQLLAFGRQHVTEPTVLDLNNVVLDFCGMVKGMVSHAIDVVVETSPDPQPILADPSQVEQILLNLVVNARDAMPDGGRLQIAVGTPADSPEDASDDPDRRWVELVVTDTGVGMDAYTQAQIFEPFFTTKGIGGTGLGLSTVYGAVQVAGGHIDVVSQPGRGTQFAIYFPRCDASVASSASEPAIPASAPARILLVDDEVAVRQFVESALAGLGYRVTPAAGVEEAMAILENPNEQVDLILTDLIMRDGDGHNLVKAADKTRGPLPVLFMSGYAPVRLTSEALHSGRQLLRKPFTIAALSRRVKETLDAPVTAQADRDTVGSS